MEKRKLEKEGKNLRVLIFLSTINLATLKTYVLFEHFGSHRSREICDRKFYWREGKMDR